jgi:centromere protein C
MPTSARKSSFGGSRRGPLKAHVPFRGDNPEVGKKTGYTVQHVERKSDGFEPFEDIIRQADKRTPPKMKSGKRRQIPASPIDEEDGGEMSMDVENSTRTS